MIKHTIQVATLVAVLAAGHVEASREFVAVLNSQQTGGVSTSLGSGVGAAVLVGFPGDWTFNYTLYISGFDWGAYFYGEPVTGREDDDVLGFGIRIGDADLPGAHVYSVLDPDFEAGSGPVLQWLYPTVVRVIGAWDLPDGNPDGRAAVNTGVGNLAFWAERMLAAEPGISLPLVFEVRTTAFPDGAVRGQLVTAIPEPATEVMILGGLGLLGLVASSQQRRARRRNVK